MAIKISGVNVIDDGRNFSGVGGTFTGDLTVAGVLNYNITSVGIVSTSDGVIVSGGGIDAVGIITAHDGIQVLANGIDVVGVLTAKNGVNVTGIVTATSFDGDLTGNADTATTATTATTAQGLTGTPNLNVGVVTATSFVGSGASLTDLPISSGGSNGDANDITASLFL